MGSRAAKLLLLVTAAGLALGGCGSATRSASSTTTTVAPWCRTLMRETFVEGESATISSHGTATVVAKALAVRCAPGTLDDVQFRDLVKGERSETLYLRSGATLTGVKVPGGVQPLPLRDLPAYLKRDADGNVFRVVGPLKAVAKLLAQYRP